LAIIFIGDLAYPFYKSIELNDLKKICAKKICVANLEGALDPSGLKVKDKLNYSIYSSSAIFQIFENMEMVVVSLANNHAGDFIGGVDRTKRLLSERGIKWFGLAGNEYVQQRVDGEEYLILGVCSAITGLSRNKDIRIKEFKPKCLLTEISEIKKQDSNVKIIIYIHWGYELAKYPQPADREWARKAIDFGIVGPEGPILGGVRDLVEKETGIPIICPTKEFAIEGSKVAQRRLFQEIIPEANPRFKVFNPKHYANLTEVKEDLWRWLDELDNQVVVKPDGVSAGKGVGVWGDHFTDRHQLFEHFLSNYTHGLVIVEEKIIGEESSFQAFCDGKHLVPLPETRAYKRAFDADTGPNTGGMGSFKDTTNWLPFTGQDAWEQEVHIAENLFQELKGQGFNPNLRGIPFYLAFMHTGSGLKILECNSRPGDPEIQNLLPILKDDFVDVCFQMIDGTLGDIAFEHQATVVTYKVPPNYGGYMKIFPQLVNKKTINGPIDLSKANSLMEQNSDRIRVYPGSMELRDSGIFALRSRAVAILGMGDTIEEARQISLDGINAINGGALWNRIDIASREHIQKSIDKMNLLRSSK